MVSYLEPPAPPARLDGPPVRGRALVLAPHPDDETIGPGGTVIQHATAGDEVRVLFVTAGTSGDPTGEADPAEYAALRQREARAAAEVLGVSGVDFWGYPDGFQVNENDLASVVPRMVDFLADVAPAVVYAPHPGDQHSDHYVVSVVLCRALAALPRPPDAFGYEVWSASPATSVNDVSMEYERKLRALRCYESQLLHTDIERFISSLNAYRAVFLEKGARFGEAFVPLLPDADAGRVAPGGDGA